MLSTAHFRRALLPKLFFLATLCLLGCKKEDNAGAPVTPALTGNIVGYVLAFDGDGNRWDDAGTTAKIEGQAIQSTTDATGRFELQNVKAGTYNLAFTRPGFASTRRPSVSHVGGEQPTFLGQIAISGPSSVTLTNFVATPGSPGASFRVNVANTGGNDVRIGLFANEGATPDFNRARFVRGLYLREGMASGSIFISDFDNAGFRRGQTVHLFLVGFPAVSDAYLDPATGLPAYPGLGQPSNPQDLAI